MISLPAEDRVGSDPCDDDQVAPLARGGRRVPFSADTDLRAGVDPRRDRDLDPARSRPRSPAAAGAAGGRQAPACAGAGPAPGGHRPIPMQGDAHRTSLADRAGLGRPAAGAAGRRRRPHTARGASARSPSARPEAPRRARAPSRSECPRRAGRIRRPARLRPAGRPDAPSGRTGAARPDPRPRGMPPGSPRTAPPPARPRGSRPASSVGRAAGTPGGSPTPGPRGRPRALRSNPASSPIVPRARAGAPSSSVRGPRTPRPRPRPRPSSSARCPRCRGPRRPCRASWPARRGTEPRPSCATPW